MFDLDAAVTDAAPEPFRFTWAGQNFEMPVLLALPIDQQLKLIAAIEGLSTADPAQIVGVINLILGEDLLARISAARPLSAAGLMKLIEGWMAHQGGAPGKSPVSLVSSASTAKPSKPTSRSGRGRKTS